MPKVNTTHVKALNDAIIVYRAVMRKCDSVKHKEKMVKELYKLEQLRLALFDHFTEPIFNFPP